MIRFLITAAGFAVAAFVFVVPAPLLAQAGMAPPTRERVSTIPPAPLTAPTAEADPFADLRGRPGGMTSDEVARRAIDAAPTVDRAIASSLVARAAAERAFVAIWPRVDASFRYTRLSEVQQGQLFSGLTDEQIAAVRAQIAMVTDPAARGLFTSNFDQQIGQANFRFPQVLDNFAFRAGLTWPISDVFLTLLPTNRGLSRIADSALHQAQAERLTIALQAREAFFGVARARAALAAARLTADVTNARLRDVTAFVEAGTAPRADLLRVQALVASTHVGIARAEGAVRVAETAVRTLLRLPPTQEIVIGEDLLAPADNVDELQTALVDRAMRDRPEVAALRALIAGREELSVARGNQRLPHLAIQGNFDYANPNQRVFPQTGEFRPSWDVSAIVSWSPNDFATAENDHNGAEAELRQARDDLDTFENAIRIEVSQAFEGYDSARNAVAAAESGIAAAEEAYRVRVERYRAGSATTTDVIDAGNELVRSRFDLVNAAIDARAAQARLRRATGRPD